MIAPPDSVLGGQVVGTNRSSAAVGVKLRLNLALLDLLHIMINAWAESAWGVSRGQETS